MHSILPQNLESGTDVKLCFAATQHATRQVSGAIRSRLQAWTLSADMIDRTDLVLTEVFNNIVEHAFGGRDDVRTTISIAITLTDQGLDCRVVDHGRPLPATDLPMGEQVAPDTPRADLPEGGFGWFLIRQLTDGICYCRRDGQNRLRFWIPLANETTPESACPPNQDAGERRPFS